MRPGQTVLVTGVTGTIGSWIAAEALRRGLNVLGMVRGDDSELAHRRVLAALATAGAGPAARDVRIVLGDLQREGLGLAPAASLDATTDADAESFLAPMGWDRPGNVSLVCHCAADVSFDDSEPEIRERINVAGTAAVLELASRLGADLMHVSTAYVAGTRREAVRESELDRGQGFNNGYEETKCRAERLVRDWARRTGRRAIILRPSIVLGDYTTGRTIHFNALYQFLRFFDRTRAGRGGAVFRVQARADATMNIVPVDFVARAAWGIAAHRAAGVFHLTHPHPVVMDDLAGMFTELFEGFQSRFVDPADFDREPATRLEQALLATAQPYLPYMQSEPVFDRTNIAADLGRAAEPPEIDAAYLLRLLEYARQVEWGRETGKASDSKPQASGAAGALLVDKQPSTSLGPEAFERYFGEFLAGKMNQRLLPDLHSLSAAFRVVPREQPDAAWLVEIREGILTSVARDGRRGQCSYIVNTQTLLAVVAGKMTPQEAFFRRRVEIEGDLETGLRVAFVLASFFRTFPFEMTEQVRATNR